MNWREMEEEREGTVVIIILEENGSITIASTTRPIQLPILEIRYQFPCFRFRLISILTQTNHQHLYLSIYNLHFGSREILLNMHSIFNIYRIYYQSHFNLVPKLSAVNLKSPTLTVRILVLTDSLYTTLTLLNPTKCLL
jgi:hypothetical protein